MTAVEGTTRIIRLLLRTGWRRLLLWWGACTALVVATCAGTVSLYPEASDRATYAATLGRSTATAAFNGRGYDLHTLGGIGAYEVGFLGQLSCRSPPCCWRSGTRAPRSRAASWSSSRPIAPAPWPRCWPAPS